MSADSIPILPVIVVGLGVQGLKRRRIAGVDFVAAVDPDNPDADYRHIQDVPVDSYAAALICTPDAPKAALLTFLVEHGKHALVEKPLLFESEAALQRLEDAAHAAGVLIYTAYNHRFEPHFIRMRDLITSGELGEIYSCRLFYGNGTARQVRDSVWRDQGAGVIPDLGSHLLDTCNFWFGSAAGPFELQSASRFENRSPDHAVLVTRGSSPRVELEMTLCMWRNHFTCDVLAERGSAHIESLCKWGPATFTVRSRVLPSGKPHEESITLVQDDPTWRDEYAHFKELISDNARTAFSKDVWIQRMLKPLVNEVGA